MALRSVAQASTAKPAVALYRNICKELPRIMTIFSLDIPAPVVRGRIADMFRANAHVKDERVVRMLVTKGYLELEETVLQYKTRHQLLNKIDPTQLRTHVKKQSFMEGFLSGTV
mmetsp:Transcript_21997/g.39352  ORF Transcript_21997/g.39352 Transcript_21997/m.39352 type:complete len:114 (+) Transcript_21997:73-414(+)|eukprot:CAMPEP_0205908458 /NCGR_PEP_ID=MMETSP1325-20131115/3232_1 /ASSEMBLY_ACC=CAM_ASM_000708 /TAXON_ID=236786 /ORGANISM="Florenciella sp., Strain RCC1007" /LENGTH=113 /DNA_ID=CAMNT_0053274661 /DNA_START=73 /DNA_END=414 /DNA_ORIENTATION=-